MKKLFWLAAAISVFSACSEDAATEHCTGGRHLFNNVCEEDTIEHCGSHDKDCSSLEGWKAGMCTQGECVASECLDHYDLQNGQCAPATPTAECPEGKHAYEDSCENDSLIDCGSHGNDCTQAEGWKEGKCENGKCVATQCADNFELKDDHCAAVTQPVTECPAGKHAFEEGCEEDSPANCGSHDNDCTKLEGWKEGICENGKCKATECADDFEIKDGLCTAVTPSSGCPDGKHSEKGECVEDTVEKCGTSLMNCTKLEGWKEGTCDKGKCTPSKCIKNYCLDPTKLLCFHGISPQTCGITGDVCEVCAEGQVCAEGKCAVGCKSNQHEYNGGCEDNSIYHCGSHGNQCHLSHATSYACYGGYCSATSCDTGFHVAGGKCVPDDNNNCGKQGVACTTGAFPHSMQVSCVSGTCTVTKCEPGYSKSGNTCTSVCKGKTPYRCGDGCCEHADCSGYCIAES